MPGAFLASIIALIYLSSSSFLPTTLSRLWFLPSLIIAAQRQVGWLPDMRISCSMVLRNAAGVISAVWSSDTLDVSTVQKTVSALVDRGGEEVWVMLIGVRLAASAYD